jgi:3-methyladenine DNA glycosylase/8-oxoguanine DNA glycosylase
MRASRFTLDVPRDYILKRDVCSYGYFLLRPNHWDVVNEAFTRVLDLDRHAGPVTLRVTQPPPPSARIGASGKPASKRSLAGEPLRVVADRALSAAERTEAREALSRMLRLDEPHTTIREFHALDPRWKKSGRGRLMRSPTLFEDVIKTVTSCNVQWPSTVVMNRRLCEVVGRGGAFPSSKRLARTRVATLRARCRTGYRDARIVQLATMFADGAIDPAWYENPNTPDEAVREALLELPGIGPYAAANIMQLLGRYAHLPLDTESVRHGRSVLGMKGSSNAIMKRVGKHFAPFGRHAFRSYWFELWEFYESKRGPSWTWERDTTGSTFTASQLQ